MLHPWHSTIRSTKNDHKGRNSKYWRDVRYQICPCPKLSMVLLAKTSIPNASQRVSPGTRFSKPASVNNQPFLEAGWCWRWMFPPEALIHCYAGNLIILSPAPQNGNCSKITPPKKNGRKQSLGDSAWITSLGSQWINKMLTKVSFVFWKKIQSPNPNPLHLYYYNYTILIYTYIVQIHYT